jgi:predicted AAA+ superfamily ATPase
LETEGKEFSPTNILNYLKSNGQEMSKDTLYNYTDALVRTFILNKVSKYDVTGKKVLTNLPKYYVSDLGLKKIKTTNKKINYSSNLESLVYNELKIKGYEVYVGKTTKGEVDFIAIKENTPIYIQVTYMLAEQSTIDREFGAFDNIKDNYPKYVISMDELDMSQNGIKHLNIIDFLLKDEL